MHNWESDLDKEVKEGLWEEVIINSGNVEMKHVKIAPGRKNSMCSPHHWKEKDDHKEQEEYQCVTNTEPGGKACARWLECRNQIIRPCWSA